MPVKILTNMRLRGCIFFDKCTISCRAAIIGYSFLFLFLFYLSSFSRTEKNFLTFFQVRKSIECCSSLLLLYILVNYFAPLQFPLISYDGWLSVQSLISKDEVGCLNVLSALGSHDQVIGIILKFQSLCTICLTQL